MKTSEAIQIIDSLVSISTKNPNFINEGDQPSKSFGLGDTNVSFIGLEAISKYQEGLTKLYNFDREIAETISIKKFENTLVQLIRELRDSITNCDEPKFKGFTNSLLELEKTESEILYELYGAEMEAPTISLGDFTIYNFKKAESILVEKYPYLTNRELYFNRRQSDIFLGIKVAARENAKAVEKADELVEIFENVMNYVITDLTHVRSVGVFNFRGWRNTSRVVCNNSSMGFHGSNEIWLPVKIEDKFFTDSSSGNDKIWPLITKADKTELERRLIQAIEWIGKGVHDKDKSKALVQFVFSIEGMLQYDGKTLITPSIVSQLSDWLAFIIQDQPDKRKQIAKYFKGTYKKRSAIVHGGAKTIDIKDLQIAL